MTRDEFEKLTDGTRVRYDRDVIQGCGTVVKHRGEKWRVDWDDGGCTWHFSSNIEFWFDAISIAEDSPRPLTANEQLLVSELKKAVSIIDDLERRLARHERAKRDGSASARAAILKVAGGGA